MATRTSGKRALEELSGDELRYLLEACRLLRRIGFDVCDDEPEDDDRFDRDELGIDPEEDYD